MRLNQLSEGELDDKLDGNRRALNDWIQKYPQVFINHLSDFYSNKDDAPVSVKKLRDRQYNMPHYGTGYIRNVGMTPILGSGNDPGLLDDDTLRAIYNEMLQTDFEFSVGHLASNMEYNLFRLYGDDESIWRAYLNFFGRTRAITRIVGLASYWRPELNEVFKALIRMFPELPWTEIGKRVRHHGRDDVPDVIDRVLNNEA